VGVFVIPSQTRVCMGVLEGHLEDSMLQGFDVGDVEGKLA